jgi:hypothetical protein
MVIEQDRSIATAAEAAGVSERTCSKWVARYPVHGDVSLVINTGPSAPAPMPAIKGRSIGREVGHFTIDIP